MEFPYIVRSNLVITAISSPHYVKADGSVIGMTLTVADAERGPIEIEFSAQPDDTEEHGRLLFAYAKTLGPAAYIQNPELIKSTIATRRYAEEIKGITLNGVSINTERDSQNLINGAVVSGLLDPNYICNWKTPDGFVQLDVSTLQAIATAVRAHVQACFDREAALIATVDAGTYTPNLLNTGWPV